MAAAGALLACLVLACRPALAAPAERPAQAQQTIASGSDLVIVVRQLIAAKDYDAARQVIRAWRPSDATYEYRVRYVEGLIQKDRGDYPAAIDTFRAILADQPGFTFVRLDLTDALYSARQDDAARHQAEMLIASGVDDQLGGGLKSIVGAIDARRPFRFRSYASVLPSSNINVGTDREIVDIGGLPFVIESSSRRKSGVGLMLGGEALLRHELDPKWALVGSGSLIARMYPDIGRIDLDVGLTAGVERRFDRGVATLSAVGEQDYTDLDAAFRSYGGRVELSRYVGEKGRVYGSLTLTERDYLDSAYRDGWRAELNGSYDYFISPERFLRLIGGGIRESAETAAYSFDEISAGLGAYSELPKGVTIYTQGVLARRVYDEPLAMLDLRKDDRFEAQVTLTKRDFQLFGLAPQVTYAFVRNVSTSAFDDFTTHNVDLRFTKEF